MVSTPNRPGGLFESIELEPAERCLYKRLYLDYTYGLNKIYSEEEIAEAMASPSFQREYCLKYGGHIGTTFSESSIQAAIEKGSQLYDPNKPKAAINPFAKKAMAIDPGWGSSACGFCVCQLLNVSTTTTTTTDPIIKKTTTITKTYTDSNFGSLIQVLYAEEFNRPNFNVMVDVARNLMYQYGIIADTDAKVYVDSSASAFTRALKIAIGEDPNYEDVIERSKRSGFRSPDHWLGKVVPIRNTRPC